MEHSSGQISVHAGNKIEGQFTSYKFNFKPQNYPDQGNSFVPEVGDFIDGKYQLVQKIGHGTFGTVFKTFDRQNETFCALKLVEENSKNRRISVNELEILKQLKAQDKDCMNNIVKLVDCFSYLGYTCMVFELLCINLFQLLYRNNYNGFSLKLVRKFSLCILRSLRFMHVNGIIHCDLKPENILLERPGYPSVKIIDFGSSCHVGQTVYTYIQSRFYRAPEVILGGEYDSAIDIWSLGCIIMELITGTPLFPGTDEADQIACIVEVLGVPPERFLKNMKKQHKHFTDSGTPIYLVRGQTDVGYINKEGDSNTSTKIKRANPGTLSLHTLLKNALGDVNTNLLDFLKACLQWTPSSRITAEEAFNHPWICDTDDDTRPTAFSS